LLEYLKKSSANIYRYWYITLLNDILSFKSFDLLQKMIAKYNIGNPDLANNLLSGQVKSKSEEAIISVLSLKEIIKNNKDLISLFKLSNQKIKKELEQTKYQDFKRKIDKYLDLYGDRTLSELKLEVSSPRRDLNKFINLLKGQLKSDTSIASYKQRQADNYTFALNAVNQSLKNWQLKKFVFFWVKKKAVYGLKNRENMRFARASLYSLLKDIYLEIGWSMQSQNLLKEATDIFYLTTNEVQLYTQDQYAINWKLLVNERKEEYNSYGRNTPDRIVFLGEKPPLINLDIDTIFTDKDTLKGIAVSKGIVTSTAKIIHYPEFTLDLKNKILVTKITDPGWVFLMTQSVGLISEKGSLLSHTAIIGRELGIPVVVGVANATSIIQNHTQIELNGNTGIIKIIK
jgi:pyruvate,water dikinase